MMFSLAYIDLQASALTTTVIRPVLSFRNGCNCTEQGGKTSVLSREAKLPCKGGTTQWLVTHSTIGRKQRFYHSYILGTHY